MAEYFKKEGDKYVPVEDKLLGQEDVDKVVETRLERQKKQFADYDELKAKAGKVDDITSEFTEKLKKAADEKSEVEKQLGGAKLETVKVKAIHKFKLSDDLSEFLNGENEDTILSQAEKLSKGIPGGSVVIDKDPKPDDKKSSDTKKVARNLFGGNKSDD